MESINKITKYLFSVILLTAIQGCWTSENDVMEVDKLVGKFKIIYIQNDAKAGYILSLNSKQGSYEYIETRCEQIYFDSTEIFVTYTWHDADTTRHYCRIKIHANEKISYQKEELSSKEFYRRVDSCKECKVKKYLKTPSF